MKTLSDSSIMMLEGPRSIRSILKNSSIAYPAIEEIGRPKTFKLKRQEFTRTGTGFCQLEYLRFQGRLPTVQVLFSDRSSLTFTCDSKVLLVFENRNEWTDVKKIIPGLSVALSFSFCDDERVDVEMLGVVEVVQTGFRPTWTVVSDRPVIMSNGVATCF